MKRYSSDGGNLSNCDSWRQRALSIYQSQAAVVHPVRFLYLIESHTSYKSTLSLIALVNDCGMELWNYLTLKLSFRSSHRVSGSTASPSLPICGSHMFNFLCISIGWVKVKCFSFDFQLCHINNARPSPPFPLPGLHRPENVLLYKYLNSHPSGPADPRENYVAPTQLSLMCKIFYSIL